MSAVLRPTRAATGGGDADDVDAEVEGPGLPIPLGRRVELPGRGTTFVREVEGPPGAPTLVLLHGWIASGGLNWYQVFGPASEHFRVIAIDHRGHARGIRSSRRFRLADCADDVAALLDVLDIDSAVMAGYSMGGPIAQLVWKRHRHKVDGLVLCATGHVFVPLMRERLTFSTMMAVGVGTSRFGEVVTHLPHRLVAPLLRVRVRERPTSLQRWAAAEMRRHDVRMILEAGRTIGHYDARGWIGDVDVPTAVLITTRDRALDPGQQAKLAFAVPGASIHRVDDGHMVCASPDFAAPFMEAALTVAQRAGLAVERRSR